ncbi:MAG: DUF1801 domain-containing protein [Bacteroidia bacterium]|nr:DUF1801 domain-containing protein [Bacteroidia bacterium]
MQSKSFTVEAYLLEIPEERAEYFNKLRNVIIKNIPKGFEETMSYGMIGYVVPHKLYPAGYHCDPKLPLPFVSIASQKNFIALYHMGIYANPKLLEWFVSEYPKHCKTKLDMGKSCIRFKKMDDIPHKLIGELMQKITVKDWITLYETNFKSSSKK